MKQYHDLLKEILTKGEVQYEPRTEEYILGIPGFQRVYDLREGFPLMTTKNVPIRLPAEELFWKLRGERSVKSLFDRTVHIWDANAFQKYLQNNGLDKEIPKHTKRWAEEFEAWKERLSKGKEDGDLGPVYGYQWRHWKKPIFVKGHAEGIEWVPDQWEVKEVDQLEKLLKGIKEKPGSRYHILNAYNVGDLSDMALGPCPFWHQFTVYGNSLDLHMVQRSCDTFLGIPFNIAQDSLLAHLVARETGLEARRFIHTTVNTHIYLGVPPRSDFWTNPANVTEFQMRVDNISGKVDYKEVRDWYLIKAPIERELDVGKDHIPDVLTQLAKKPRDLPTLILENIPLYDAIEKPAEEIVRVSDYNPHKWKTNSQMAA